MRKSLMLAIFLTCFYRAGFTQASQLADGLLHELTDLKGDTS